MSDPLTVNPPDPEDQTPEAHDWHGADIESGIEVRRLSQDHYQLRHSGGQVTVDIDSAEFESWRARGELDGGGNDA